jgi:hypothetical protein
MQPHYSNYILVIRLCVERDECDVGTCVFVNNVYVRETTFTYLRLYREVESVLYISGSTFWVCNKSVVINVTSTLA